MLNSDLLFAAWGVSQSVVLKFLLLGHLGSSLKLDSRLKSPPQILRHPYVGANERALAQIGTNPDYTDYTDRHTQICIVR